MSTLHAKSAVVITVLNLKGGVGKTHTAWLLASVSQERGHRVLLIDTDTQGNLSSSFLDQGETVRGVEMLLHPGSDHDPLPLVRRTPFSHIDIIPSSAAVARFDRSDKDDWEKAGLQRCFIDPMQALSSKYDYIVFDCPPRLSLVSFAALAASDGIVIPMETADWGAQGIDTFCKFPRHLQPASAVNVKNGFSARRCWHATGAWFDCKYAPASTRNAASNAPRNARANAPRRRDDASSCPRCSTTSSWWPASTDAARSPRSTCWCMPPTAPMSDAPPPPLPVNPRPAQPSPKTSMQAQQEANMLGLQEQKNMPGMATEELNDQSMAMGAKMAGFDWLGLGHQARRWDDNVPAMQEWSASTPSSPE
jgi:hypothetical protein